MAKGGKKWLKVVKVGRSGESDEKWGKVRKKWGKVTKSGEYWGKSGEKRRVDFSPSSPSLPSMKNDFLVNMCQVLIYVLIILCHVIIHIAWVSHTTLFQL